MRDIREDMQEQLNKAVEWTADCKNLNEAEDIINGVLNCDPKSPTLLYYLANLYMQKKYTELAIYIYKLSLSFNDKLPATWNNLGYAFKSEQKLDEATEAFEKACELDPSDSDSLMNYGSMFVANGTPNKAISIFNDVLKLKSDSMPTLWNKSLAFLELGRYKEGWELYENRFSEKNTLLKNYHKDKTPMWDGTKGQTIVIYGEQGIGDQIMWLSILPDVMKDCNVILDAHPRLFRILRNSFPNIPIFGTWKDPHMFWTQSYQIDAAIPLGSLCKFYRNKKEDFPLVSPYLKADPVLIEKYRDKVDALPGRIKIGISWKGGIGGTNKKDRSIKLKEWLPLFNEIDADFISLQYQEDAEHDIEKFYAENPNAKKIIHWRDMVDDYDETAALVSNLDFVVSVPQSVVHLAGGLGIPTFQLTPKRAMWQMGVYGHDMPWYKPFVRNIWQKEVGMWEPVIKEAKENVCNLFQKATEIISQKCTLIK